MADRCKDCGRRVATEADLTACEIDCDGCKACLSLCWRLFHADTCQAPRRRRLIGWRVRWEWRPRGDRTWTQVRSHVTALHTARQIADRVAFDDGTGARRNVRVMRVFVRAKKG